MEEIQSTPQMDVPNTEQKPKKSKVKYATEEERKEAIRRNARKRYKINYEKIKSDEQSFKEYSQKKSIIHKKWRDSHKDTVAAISKNHMEKAKKFNRLVSLINNNITYQDDECIIINPVVIKEIQLLNGNSANHPKVKSDESKI